MTFIKIGDSSSESRIISKKDIEIFADISHDKNPLHLDDDYAKKSIFGKKIAHGFLVASSISAILANKLPGAGSIYLSQELKFKKPVYIDDNITTIVTVAEIPKPQIFILKTICINQNGETVIDGIAVVKNTEVRHE
jgi:acyl dehydratase